MQIAEPTTNQSYRNEKPQMEKEMQALVAFAVVEKPKARDGERF